MVKDEAEIALLARAGQITAESFDAVLASIGPGVTEREIAIALEREMIDRGAEKLAFDTIVASGPNGDTPHHVPTSRPVSRRGSRHDRLRRPVCRLSRGHDQDGGGRRACRLAAGNL